MTNEKRAYTKGVYAGTFGPLHEGHKIVIRETMKVADHLVIGITDDHLATKKVKGTKQVMQNFFERYKAMFLFLDGEYPGRFDIVSIGDGIKEGVQFDGDLLVISTENDVIARALEINDLRREKKKKELVMLVVPELRDRCGQIVTSTRIRCGEIMEYD